MLDGTRVSYVMKGGSTAGVLYDGINELELASTFDTYGATTTTRLLSVSQTRQLITTQYGLQLVPHWVFNDVPGMDRLIVSGGQARQQAAADVNVWELEENMAPVFYPHADQPQRFGVLPNNRVQSAQPK
jgi:AraC family transcriptional regulator, transcriptional activator FtrA